MNKITVFEITSHTISIMVGSVIEGKPAIVFNYSVEYSLLVKDGKFINKEFLVNEIIKIFGIASSKVSDLSTKGIFVSFPNDSLSVHLDSSSVAVCSSDGTYTEQDIRNIYNSIKNKSVASNAFILDISCISLRDDRNIDFKPTDYGHPTRTVTMNYSYNTVDSDDIKVYNDIFKAAKLSVKKFVVSSLSLVRYFDGLKQYPEKYVLIQSYQNRTVLSSVKNGFVLYSSSILTCIDNLYNSIVQKYDIEYEDARNVVLKFGRDLRKYNYPVYVYNKTDADGKTVKISQKDLNEMIASFLKVFIQSISVESTKILQLSKESGLNYIYIFQGDILNISGFADSFDPSFRKSILFYKSNNPCAMNQDDACMLSIIANSGYYSYQADIENRVEVPISKSITRGE